MRKEETIILEREDMIETRNGKDIRLIDLTDFKGFINPLQTGIILFIDDNGYTKILKNRHGDKGGGILIRIIEDIKANNKACIGLNVHMGEEYFNDVISLFHN